MEITKSLFRFSTRRLSLIITLMMIAVYFASPAFFDLMELKALDLRFKSRGARDAGDRVVIVAIDEKSINELGRWPWPRTRIAELIKSLSNDGARVIGFDIVFSEPDQSSGLQTVLELKNKTLSLGLDGAVLSYLNRMERIYDTDSELKEAIESSKRTVLGYFFHFEEGLKTAEKVEPEKGRYSFVKAVGGVVPNSVKEAASVEMNIAPLTNTSKTLGYFNMFPDRDGTVRWCPLTIKYGGDYYSPLSVQLAREYLGNPPLSMVTADYGVARIQLGDIVIPSDEQGRLLVNYYGPQNSFSHFSFVDVIKGRVKPGTFKDKIVIVGATEIGIYDMRVTPFDRTSPGVEIHATVTENILASDFISRPNWLSIFDLLAIISIGLLLPIALGRFKAVTSLIFTAAISIGYFFFDRFLFMEKGIWLNTVYPYLTLVSTYTVITVYKYVGEEKEKKKIKGAFQYYVTASVMDEILKHPEKLKLGGEEKELSVLFSDIRGFTTISEKVSPEILVGLLNEYFTAMTDIVLKYNGYLDKYIGDAIMAVYGAPIEQNDHAVKVCLTAVEMMAKLNELKVVWVARGLPQIDIGIGINSGKMIVGNMGSKRRFNYTVVGDNVNLASRLEGLTKEYQAPIIISESVYETVKDKFLCRELGSVTVKGKEIATRIFELVGTLPEEN